MFSVKYVGFVKQNKGRINLTYRALAHGTVPSLYLHCQWTNLCTIFKGLS